MDLTPMLSHSWTYQSLIHDVLEMKLNRITIEVCPILPDGGWGTRMYIDTFGNRQMKRSIKRGRAMILKTRITFGVGMHRIPFHK